MTDPRVPAGLQANVPQAGLAEDTARADAHAVPAGLEANVPQAGLPSDPPRRPLEIEQTLPDPSAEPGPAPVIPAPAAPSPGEPAAPGGHARSAP